MCRGPYAPHLIRAWKRYDDTRGSENDPVNMLTDKNMSETDMARQFFLIIAMSDCGVDLERGAIKTYDQVRSIIAQVSGAPPVN